AEVLWRGVMRYNPANPGWTNRDRFVLSNGHGSMLQYALLHLSGFDLSIDDLKQFRQLHSKTPGHPEYGYTPGVETTTGPLGQGIANAVGMALAEKTLAAQFNREGYPVIDHFTYCFLGDGCLMEGISHEVCSLAGTLKLGKLVAFYDDNGISIDGEVEGWFTDNTVQRFQAYNWQVIGPIDGHDSEAVRSAIIQAHADSQRPTLIICKTVIGCGSPNKQGKEDCHGAPLGTAEIALTREAMGWEHGPFEIPEDIYEAWDNRARGEALEQTWVALYNAYRKAHPELAEELDRRLKGQLPPSFELQANAYIQEVAAKGETIASRKASQNALNAFGPLLPELLGGSADLAGSNLTLWKGCHGIQENAAGNYVFYGVREFGMSAIMNGVALHGGFIPYGATFLIFMEYARNAVRMSALMKQRVIQVYTHDSIGLGEDGPTHQPIEQLASLRGTPNMSVWRPADAVESAVAWKAAIQRADGPTCLIFSRQNLPHRERDALQIENISKGGYVLSPETGVLEAIIIATGSEIDLAMQAQQALTAQGKGVRVVSLPSVDTFMAQDVAYREKVLPTEVRARVVVEASHADYWYKFAGLDGKVIGMTSFGESAPIKDLYQHFGITVDAVVQAVQDVIA
ncbi:MAG TPA: transketolase, partial [Fluviicoccus sp.]|nr:transketolase [Fluviicoccus sp.]